MAIKIRFARGGSKKRPLYSIVAADIRMARNGKFIENLGTYDPLLPKDSEERVDLNKERIKYWLGQGAVPTDRVARFLEAAGIVEERQRQGPRGRVVLGSKRRIDPNAYIEAPETFDVKVHLDLDSDWDVDQLTVAAQAFLDFLGYATEPEFEKRELLENA